LIDIEPFTAAEHDAILRAIAQRRSVRAFLPTPVPQDTIERILDVAARAPSGTNMQPWRVHVLTGAARDRVASAVVEVFRNPPPDLPASEYKYYPDTFFEPFLSRRRKVGFDMYGLIGIARGDTAAMKAQHARNFSFFDAPAGLIFTIDRRLEIGSWLDYGMFLQNVMIAARAEGLETCAQAAFAPLHAAIRDELALDPNEIVVCGMSLGYEDRTAPINALVTHREPACVFATFRDD
jgi:nitroreductase